MFNLIDLISKCIKVYTNEIKTPKHTTNRSTKEGFSNCFYLSDLNDVTFFCLVIKKCEASNDLAT